MSSKMPLDLDCGDSHVWFSHGCTISFYNASMGAALHRVHWIIV